MVWNEWSERSWGGNTKWESEGWPSSWGSDSDDYWSADSGAHRWDKRDAEGATDSGAHRWDKRDIEGAKERKDNDKLQEEPKEAQDEDSDILGDNIEYFSGKAGLKHTLPVTERVNWLRSLIKSTVVLENKDNSLGLPHVQTARWSADHIDSVWWLLARVPRKMAVKSLDRDHRISEMQAHLRESFLSRFPTKAERLNIVRDILAKIDRPDLYVQEATKEGFQLQDPKELDRGARQDWRNREAQMAAQEKPAVPIKPLQRKTSDEELASVEKRRKIAEEERQVAKLRLEAVQAQHAAAQYSAGDPASAGSGDHRQGTRSHVAPEKKHFAAVLKDTFVPVLAPRGPPPKPGNPSTASGDHAGGTDANPKPKENQLAALRAATMRKGSGTQDNSASQTKLDEARRLLSEIEQRSFKQECESLSLKMADLEVQSNRWKTEAVVATSSKDEEMKAALRAREAELLAQKSEQEAWTEVNAMRPEIAALKAELQVHAQKSEQDARNVAVLNAELMAQAAELQSEARALKLAREGCKEATARKVEVTESVEEPESGPSERGGVAASTDSGDQRQFANSEILGEGLVRAEEKAMGKTTRHGEEHPEQKQELPQEVAGTAPDAKSEQQDKAIEVSVDVASGPKSSPAEALALYHITPDTCTPAEFKNLKVGQLVQVLYDRPGDGQSWKADQWGVVYIMSLKVEKEECQIAAVDPATGEVGLDDAVWMGVDVLQVFP